jgi:hypothetical protein
MSVFQPSTWTPSVWVIVIVILAMLLGSGIKLYAQDPNRLNKFATFLGYFVAAWLAFYISSKVTNHPLLFFGAFFLGTLTAFAEIIQKFSDEPMAALGTPQALIYHVLNGAISISALYLLLLYGVPIATQLEKIQAVVVAGLGAMLIMRSKLFNVKAGDKEIAFGPEQIINVFLRFMEHSIDRIRSSARIAFIKRVMDNLDFEHIVEYTLTMIESAQALGDRKDQLIKVIGELRTDQDVTDRQLRSYRMGFLMLNTMGEDFVEELYSERRPEWLIKAPEISQSPSIFERLGIGGESRANLFTFDLTMSPGVLARRLKWGPIPPGQRSILRGERCKLEGYCLKFAPTSNEQAGGTVAAYLSPDRNQSVEGIIYKLPGRVLPFLDREMPGFQRQPVKVTTADHKKREAQAYFPAGRVQEVPPTSDYAHQLAATAKEQGLSDSYVANLGELAETEA